ncbi:hypothetical protein ACMZ60_06100 [Streptococcus pluranimalium]
MTVKLAPLAREDGMIGSYQRTIRLGSIRTVNQFHKLEKKLLRRYPDLFQMIESLLFKV